MNYLHYEFNLSTDDVVELSFDKQANVRLIDTHNYAQYKNGRHHQFYGGLAKVSPLRLQAPHPGHWHVVVDLGGYAGNVRASARVIRN